MFGIRKAALAGLAAISGLVLALGPAAPASAEESVEGPFTIANPGTGKCLEVADWSDLNGAAIRQWDCHGGLNQLWYIVDVNLTGYSTLVNASSHKCVDIPGGNVGNGVQLIQWDCHYESNQRWAMLYPHGDGPDREFAWGSYRMEIGGYSRANGAPAQLWARNGGENQQWGVGVR
ncbi:RICIN domain-containing protein [Kitasatospora sp. NPDC051914]|uniref:RICIN domain-containing protein n=1 Tax=Kitasatospora sp. NPDC051914 TaxID=3154945 RepID=UPI003423AC7D